MKVFKKVMSLFFGLAICMPCVTISVAAQNLSIGELARGGKGGTNGGGGSTSLPSYYNWMSAEITGAWSEGYLGQGVRATIVDDFTSAYGNYGDLGDGLSLLRHGEWTRKQVTMIAPSATIASQDFYSGRSVSLDRKKLNVLNLSYGMYAAEGYSNESIGWAAQESSIISYAQTGRAVVVKAAGNDAVAVDAANFDGNVDYLNRALVGAQAVLFAGALDRNGAPNDLASIAWYSNYAGNDTSIQNQYLMVGVRGDLTDLYGTSFAAPIITGYTAVLGSKFKSATPTQIVNQLLDTARTDTILGYSTSVHGRGEASISRALAPASIN